jgi:hypothetical protein
MAETRRFGAPLLEAGQAQKHVTVNEALTRLDALAAGVVLSRTLASPPSAPADGDLYVAPAGAVGAWVGRAGMLALWDNGGWSFAPPVEGRRYWVEDEGAEIVHTGAAWVTRDAGLRRGAAMRLEVVTLDHAVPPGLSSVTAPLIPEKASVVAVTGRVLEPLTGAGVTAWRLGVAGASSRYGNGYGLAAGSFAHGMTSQPMTYFAATGLLIEATGGGTFTGGRIRLAAHCIIVEPPAAA